MPHGTGLGVESRTGKILYYYILWCELEYTTRYSVWQPVGGRNVDMFLEALLLQGNPSGTFFRALKSEGEVDGFTLFNLRGCDRKWNGLCLPRAIGIADFLSF